MRGEGAVVPCSSGNSGERTNGGRQVHAEVKYLWGKMRLRVKGWGRGEG